MKKNWLAPFLVALFMVVFPLSRVKAQPPFLGETLSAEITFLNIPVATAILRVTEQTAESDETVYHLAISAKSTPFYSLIYKVDNQYDSYFTWPEAGTLRYRRSICEPGVDLRRTVRYQDGQALCNGEEPVSVPPSVRDLFLAMYALRGKRLDENQVIDSPLELDGQLWTIRAKVIGREKVNIQQDSHPSIKVQVRFLHSSRAGEEKRASDILTNNLVREKTKLTIWFAEDELKTPLKAQCRAAFFTIKALFSTLD